VFEPRAGDGIPRIKFPAAVPEISAANIEKTTGPGRAVSEDGPYREKTAEESRRPAGSRRYEIKRSGPSRKMAPTKARNELRHYKEGTRFRLVPGISDIVALSKADDESAYGMRRGKGRAKA